MTKSMLGFYQEHDISPVKQDIRDLPAHFARRAFLYRSLGLPPMAIQGKSVLEVGPGSGENALYTLSLQPETYVLVEPNEKARRALEATFVDTFRGEVCIIGQTIETYSTTEPFDVVLCEGLLGLAGGNARNLLTAVGEKVKIGGVLVITCIDAISQCADVLRRAMAHRILDRSKSLQEQVEQLRPVFTPHLATLKGMTRSVDDWILDNILNPASIGPTFSIPDACEALEGRFEILGCSPRFLLDWRWYKEAEPGNQWAIESYWRNCHNLLDYRTVEPETTEERNKALMAQCLEKRWEVSCYERGSCQRQDTSAVENDIGWFGRGQQYLSFVRVQ